MHLKRWITGLSALPFLIWLIYSGGSPFFILIGVVFLVALIEYYHITGMQGWKSYFQAIPLAGILTGILILFAAGKNRADAVIALLTMDFLLCGVVLFFRYANDPDLIDRIGKQFLGVAYISCALSSLILIRNGDQGMKWVFLLVFVIFAGDVGAFYAGRRFGKRKLCPSVSPGKTVEGALGGLAGNILFGIPFMLIFLPEIPFGFGVLLFLIMGAAGQLGDLFESAFKRNSGIKDSGSILPGHGGLLDRIDALLFAIPTAYLFKQFLIG